MSLTLEASELLEHFQWKNGKDIDTHVAKNKEEIANELIDMLSWVLLISHDLHIDLNEAFYKKKHKTRKNILSKKLKVKPQSIQNTK